VLKVTANRIKSKLEQNEGEK
jgi:hypothetical protein